MLILRRKIGESLIVNENVWIKIVESSNDGVRLAIEAPKDVQILREELIEARKANQEAATSVGKENVKRLKRLIK